MIEDETGLRAEDEMTEWWDDLEAYCRSNPTWRDVLAFLDEKVEKQRKATLRVVQTVLQKIALKEAGAIESDAERRADDELMDAELLDEHGGTEN